MPSYTGTNNADTIYGSASGDFIYGYGGNDMLLGQDGGDTLYGGDGNDNLFGHSALTDSYSDNLFGENGDDHLFMSVGDYANGGSGYDTLYVYLMNASAGQTINFSALWSGGTVSIAGGSATAMESLFVVYGSNYADTITAGSVTGTAPQIFGWGGSDTLYGGDGNDWIEGQAMDHVGLDTAVDYIYGNGGNDFVSGALGDYIDGGSGTDALKLDLTLATGGVTCDFAPLLAGYTGTILGTTLVSIEHIDSVYGTAYDDVFDTSADNYATLISAGNGNDQLLGGSGDNRLFGGAGDDWLYGGGGADMLVGGAGLDSMTGGSGADQFAFNPGDFTASLLPSQVDRITDFSRADGDKINLSPIDAITGGSDNAFSFIGNAAFSGVAGQLRYDYAGGDTMVFGDINGDGIADFAIQLTGSFSLISSDFLL